MSHEWDAPGAFKKWGIFGTIAFIPLWVGVMYLFLKGLLGLIHMAGG